MKSNLTTAAVIFVVLMSMASVATAKGDITISPDIVGNITVGVAPNSISPPVTVTYDGWGIGSTIYDIKVVRVSDNTIPSGCEVSGTLSVDPTIIELTSCKIPATDIKKAYHIYATASCPAGSCEGTQNSRNLTADAPVQPTPEMSTGILMSAGLIGLVGMTRYRRKE